MYVDYAAFCWRFKSVDAEKAYNRTDSTGTCIDFRLWPKKSPSPAKTRRLLSLRRMSPPRTFRPISLPKPGCFGPFLTARSFQMRLWLALLRASRNASPLPNLTNLTLSSSRSLALGGVELLEGVQPGRKASTARQAGWSGIQVVSWPGSWRANDTSYAPPSRWLFALSADVLFYVFSDMVLTLTLNLDLTMLLKPSRGWSSKTPRMRASPAASTSPSSRRSSARSEFFFLLSTCVLSCPHSVTLFFVGNLSAPHTKRRAQRS